MLFMRFFAYFLLTILIFTSGNSKEFRIDFSDEGIKLLKKQDPSGTFKIIENSSHFLPMEYPEIVQKEIKKIKNRV